MVFNPLSCSGWVDNASGWVANGPCLSARLGFVILFFIIAIMRKWVFELIGMPYNIFMGMGSGILSYLIIVVIFGSFKWALIIGLVIAIVGGIIGVGIFGESESY